MTKSVVRYGNQPEVMRLLEKWRISPLKKLKATSNPKQIENYPLPHNASDYLALLKYTYEMGASVKTPHRVSYAYLNTRLIKESARFINSHPTVKDEIVKNKLKPVNILMYNYDNPVFMVQFKAPEVLNDLLEVLEFLGTRKDLKNHHQRIYEEGIKNFSTDVDAIKKIKQFKPKNLFGI